MKAFDSSSVVEARIPDARIASSDAVHPDAPRSEEKINAWKRRLSDPRNDLNDSEAEDFSANRRGGNAFTLHSNGNETVVYSPPRGNSIASADEATPLETTAPSAAKESATVQESASVEKRMPADYLSCEEEFMAWCEWKKWKSVFRVEEPFSPDEIFSSRQANGPVWKDDLNRRTRWKYYNYLMKVICSQGKKIAHCWMGNDFSLYYYDPSARYASVFDAEDYEEDDERAHPASKQGSSKKRWKKKSRDDEPYEIDSRKPFISDFDGFFNGNIDPSRLKNKEDRIKYAQTRVSQADYVFTKAYKDRTRKPLETIIAMILGRKGRIKEVVKKHLQDEYGQTRRWRRAKKARKWNNAYAGTFLAEEMALCFYQAFFDPQSPYPGIDETQRQREKIFFFTESYGVQPSDEKLLSILGCRKSQANVLWNSLFTKQTANASRISREKQIQTFLGTLRKSFVPEKEITTLEKRIHFLSKSPALSWNNCMSVHVRRSPEVLSGRIDPREYLERIFTEEHFGIPSDKRVLILSEQQPDQLVCIRSLEYWKNLFAKQPGLSRKELMLVFLEWLRNDFGWIEQDMLDHWEKIFSDQSGLSPDEILEHLQRTAAQNTEKDADAKADQIFAKKVWDYFFMEESDIHPKCIERFVGKLLNDLGCNYKKKKPHALWRQRYARALGMWSSLLSEPPGISQEKKMILSEEQKKHRREFLDRLQRELSFGEEQSEELWDYFFVENPLIFSEQCVNAFIGKLLDSVDCGDRTDRALSLWDSLLRKYPRMSRKKKMRAFLDLLPNILDDGKTRTWIMRQEPHPPVPRSGDSQSAQNVPKFVEQLQDTLGFSQAHAERIWESFFTRQYLLRELLGSLGKPCAKYVLRRMLQFILAEFQEKAESGSEKDARIYRFLLGLTQQDCRNRRKRILETGAAYVCNEKKDADKRRADDNKKTAKKKLVDPCPFSPQCECGGGRICGQDSQGAADTAPDDHGTTHSVCIEQGDRE